MAIPDSSPVSAPVAPRSLIGWMLAVLAFILALSGYFLDDRYRQSEAGAAVETRNLVELIESHLSSDFYRIGGVLTYIARGVKAADLLPNPPAENRLAWGQRLADIKASFVLIQSINIFDAEGQLRYLSDQDTRAVNIADRPHFQYLRDNPTATWSFSEAQISRTTGQWSITQVRALRDTEGRFLGTVNAVIDLAGISRLFSTIDVGQGGVVLLRRSDTSALIQRTPRLNEKDFNQALPKDNPVRQRIEAGERMGTLSLTSYGDNVERLVSFKRLDGYPFYVQVGLAKAHYLVSWYQGVANFLALMAFLLLGSILAIWHLHKSSAVAALATYQMRYRQALFAGMFEQSSFLAGILDQHGHLIEVNETALKVIGLRREEVLGKYFPDTPWWSHTGDKVALERAIKAATQGTYACFEVMHPTISGGEITVLFHAVPVLAGQDRYIAVTGIDISERKQAEQKLQQEQQRLSNILWGTGVGTWEWNVQTGEARFNERWARIVGYRLEELSPISIDTWTQLVHPDDLAQSGDLLARHFSGELEHYEMEARMRHKEGRWVWVVDRGKVVSCTPDGKPEWVVGTHWDITERKHAERALKESESRQRAIIENEPECIKIVDAQGCLTRMNPAGLRMIEADTLKQVAGKPVEGLIAPEHRQAFADMHQRVLNGESVQLAFEIIGLKGGRHWMETHAVPIQENGQTVQLAVTRDITQRKLVEDALQQQTQALARSNAELEQFAYIASHDLRQPLRMITSYVQMLERRLAEKLDGDTRQMMHFVADGATRMDQMLVSLLEYSRVGRKGQPLVSMSSREGVDEALRFLAPAISEASATVRIVGDWPDIMVSRDEFTRLWQNLIGNAVKYRAPDRTPELEITVAPDDEGWRFCVADNGIGIDPGQFDRLFRVFQRLHTRNKYEGTGVGLAVARKIVERHGGRIWVESDGLDQGCRFCFTLPVRPPEADAQQ
ncbi:MAG: PAS domain S-box protein [Burkholderiaceae bacterium]|nr:PAS domain S-box protein [Burkholderiaceae bacterium]